MTSPALTPFDADAVTGEHPVCAAPCPDCPEAARRAREAVGHFVFECVCGRAYRVRRVSAPSAEFAAYAEPLAMPAPRVRGPLATRRRTYRVDPDAPSPERSPLEKAAQRALALSGTDAEAERVRVVLCDLRPDHPDASVPLPPPGTVVPTVRVTDPTASFGGIPRGLASGLGAQLAAAAALASRSGADVLREIAALPGEAAVVLRWMRRDASLASGLRGLYHDAGMHFASGVQAALWAKDLKAQRDAAPAHGRYLVLRACDAWERVMRERGLR